MKPASGTKPAIRAAIVTHPDVDRFHLLEAALTKAGFWVDLSKVRRRVKLKQAEFKIIIKPDIGFLKKGAATGTDPELVEYLIDLLHARGFTNVAVGEGCDSFDLWLENRDVLALADLVGYHFTTSAGNSYEVLDLGEDVVEAAFPAESVLHGSGLASAWLNANYRICFAKNKTDEENYFALCLHTLAGVLPLRDKDYHYHHRLQMEDVIDDLLQQTPVHFALIDAFVSNHGSAGSRFERALDTRTIIASKDILLADWVGATKMGLDPFASSMNATTLRRRGLPLNYQIEGELKPYTGWINVPALMVNSVQSRNQWMEISRLIKPWLQHVDRELFPFRELIDEQINRVVMEYLGNVDDNPLAWWGTAGLNYWLGVTYNGLKAYQTLYDKDKLRWKEAPLNLKLAAYSLSDYEDIVNYLEPLANLIQQTPALPSSLRWRYLDGSVLFEFRREIPVPYEDFIARVNIAQAIQLMNDYIGGRAIAIARDEEGRITHQAERNLYLPQPNYVVLYNGKVIDVTKLEYIRYENDEQKIFWKTVGSENSSAEFDDGIVTFSRTAKGETQVVVMGRQLFTLPLFFQVFSLDANPPLKGFLTEQAYTSFFSRTMANFEAKYEGRDVRIGRPWHDQEGQPGVENVETWPSERLAEIVEKLGASIPNPMEPETNVWSWASDPPMQPGGVLDEHGFIHFKGQPVNEEKKENGSGSGSLGIPVVPSQFGAVLGEFLTGLAAAMQKDFGVRSMAED
jgi:uncharacterized protein (DUF362 family)